MKTVEIHKYYIDTSHQRVLCEKEPLDCIALARKIESRSIGIFTWFYFYAVDFLAKYFDSFKQRQFEEVKGLANEIVRHQNSFLEKRAAIRELLQKRFTVIDTNVENLDEAEVICFGETHTEDKHRVFNAAMIDALCEKEDVILVEHDENDPSFRSPQAKHVKHRLKVKGWDLNCRDTVKQFEEASKIKIDSIESAIRILLFGIPRSQELKVQKAVQRIFDEIPARNRNMCKTIAENSLAGRRIYVIAGSDHLRPSKYSAHKDKWVNRKPQDVAYRETIDYLKTKKFAVLTPKKD